MPYISDYPTLAVDLKVRRGPLTEAEVASVFAPRFVDVWLADYGRNTPDYDAVETRDAGFTHVFFYLFDIAAGRLIAAWGLSKGKNVSPRSVIASRMKVHPLTNTVNGKRYHRGHAIPHTLGGSTDINLVPQLGAINSGPFQRLEQLAVNTPGSLYFSYWRYPDATDQRPCGVEQGCLIAGRNPEIESFGN